MDEFKYTYIFNIMYFVIGFLHLGLNSVLGSFEF